MRLNKFYLHILLDENANIVELDCTLRDIEINFEEYIGKNWFDEFIETSDKESVMKVFHSLLTNEGKWKTYANDIKINSKYRLIDFENEVITVNDKKFIKSFGVEHLDNC